jgi:hypothetical protein
VFPFFEKEGVAAYFKKKSLNAKIEAQESAGNSDKSEQSNQP